MTMWADMCAAPVRARERAGARYMPWGVRHVGQAARMQNRVTLLAVYSGTRQRAVSLWAGLADGPSTLMDLHTATGLSPSQIRYALTKLVDDGWVEVDGGWGRRGTTYGRRVPS